MADSAESNKCPKCGKGQIVCTYRWENRHTWSHDCTNPVCSMHESFNTDEECDEEDTDDDIYDERGSGKEGGCPGHGKPAPNPDDNEEDKPPDDDVIQHLPEGDDEEDY